MRRHSAAVCLIALGLPAAAGAQSLEPVDGDGRLITASEVAPGGRLLVASGGLVRPVRVEVRRDGAWRPAGPPITRVGERVGVRVRSGPGLLRLRGRAADGSVSAPLAVRVRSLRLAAVGDINLGDGPGQVIALRGAAYPWGSVGPRLRAADIAFGNLECAVSVRGRPHVKQYVFRGRPSSVRAMREVAGIDVVNLANNHAGDYGDAALIDTLRAVRRNGIVPVGAGASETAAYRPAVVESLGLKVAFVGFSEILPFEFRAIGANPGTAWAFPGRVQQGVRRARRVADVVIATFHWGVERATTESAGQRALAKLALDAGATAVIGAHPHVLQPIRRPAGKLVAYSLGNFVFGANSAGTTRTGILEVGLEAGAVRTARLVHAEIHASRPVLRGAAG